MADELDSDIEQGRQTAVYATNQETSTGPSRALTRQPTATESIWKTLSHSLSGEEYVQRTKSYYEFVAGKCLHAFI